MKRTYSEGTWFAVPLQRKAGIAVGVVARAAKKGKILLGYFFGPCRQVMPRLDEVEKLLPNQTIRIAHVSALGLIQGDWPIIGNSKLWRRSDWPTPVFVRREPIGNRTWRVYYSDTNPNEIVREELTISDNESYPVDCLLGSTATEIELTNLLICK